MLLEHERYYGLGMDALVTVCSRNTSVRMQWQNSMLSKHERCYGMGMDALVCNHMLSEHERYYGLGMDAAVTVCS